MAELGSWKLFYLLQVLHSALLIDNSVFVILVTTQINKKLWYLTGREMWKNSNLQLFSVALEARRNYLFKMTVWQCVPQEKIDHLLKSMPRRVEECVSNRRETHKLLKRNVYILFFFSSEISYYLLNVERFYQVWPKSQCIT